MITRMVPSTGIPPSCDPYAITKVGRLTFRSSRLIGPRRRSIVSFRKREEPMAITVTPLHPHIGAEVRGVDLTGPVPPDDLAAIDAAFARHAVLVFPGQKLSDEQQIAFSQHFGPLETSPDYAGSKKTRLMRREISDISNLDPEGKVMSADDKRLLFNRGNH